MGIFGSLLVASLCGKCSAAVDVASGQILGSFVDAAAQCFEQILGSFVDAAARHSYETSTRNRPSCMFALVWQQPFRFPIAPFA